MEMASRNRKLLSHDNLFVHCVLCYFCFRDEVETPTVRIMLFGLDGKLV